MFKTKYHIRKSQHILLMWFVLFALSPCVVKEVFFSVTDTEYVKPLNKTKSTTLTNFCQYSQNDKLQYTVVKQSDIKNKIVPSDDLKDKFFEIHTTEIDDRYFKNSLGNSPPKYILYKRLKLDMT